MKTSRTKVRRRALWALLFLPLLWITSSAAIAWKLTHRTLGPYPEPIPSFAGLTIEPKRLTTSDRQELGAWFAPGDPDKPAVILLHGLHGSRRQSVPLMRRLHADGYNVLAVTMRAHGDSTGRSIDFGYSSRADVVAAVDFLEREVPGAPIVICGTSLGSAAALFAAEPLGTRVHAYLLESPYRDLETATRNRLRLYLPPVADEIAYLGLRLCSMPMLPVDLTKIAPVQAAVHVPPSVHVTILTGERDRLATAAEAGDIFKTVQSHGTLLTFAKAGHGRLFHADPDRYYAALRDLLEIH